MCIEANFVYHGTSAVKSFRRVDSIWRSRWRKYQIFGELLAFQQPPLWLTQHFFFVIFPNKTHVHHRITIWFGRTWKSFVVSIEWWEMLINSIQCEWFAIRNLLFLLCSVKHETHLCLLSNYAQMNYDFNFCSLDDLWWCVKVSLEEHVFLSIFYRFLLEKSICLLTSEHFQELSPFVVSDASYVLLIEQSSIASFRNNHISHHVVLCWGFKKWSHIIFL